MTTIQNIKDHIVMIFMVAFVMIFLPLSCVKKSDIDITPETTTPFSGLYVLDGQSCKSFTMMFLSMMISKVDGENLYLHHSRRYLVGNNTTAMNSFPAYQETKFHKCPNT